MAGENLLGARLRQARIAHGYSLRKVERATGISFALLSKYELGAREPSRKRLEQLADFYGVPTDWLLGRVIPEEVARALGPKGAHEYIDRVSDDAQYNIYRTPLPPGLTADSPQDDWTAFLADAISRSGIDLDDQGRRQIAEAAAAVVATLARQKAEEQNRRQRQENEQPPKK